MYAPETHLFILCIEFSIVSSANWKVMPSRLLLFAQVDGELGEGIALRAARVRLVFDVHRRRHPFPAVLLFRAPNFGAGRVLGGHQLELLARVGPRSDLEGAGDLLGRVALVEDVGAARHLELNRRDENDLAARLDDHQHRRVLGNVAVHVDAVLNDRFSSFERLSSAK